MDDAAFDLAQLFGSIDEARRERDLSWAALSRQVGVAASTIRRFATAADAEADGVLVLIGWLGLAPEHFVADSTVNGELLAAAGDGVIRVDMALIAALPSWPRSGRGTSRTTIQRLVTAAQTAGHTVASLTRWSPI